MGLENGGDVDETGESKFFLIHNAHVGVKIHH